MLENEVEQMLDHLEVGTAALSELTRKIQRLIECQEFDNARIWSLELAKRLETIEVFANRIVEIDEFDEFDEFDD